jgi:hypothetical protein
LEEKQRTVDQVEEATVLGEPPMGNDVTDSWGMSTLGDSEVLLIETKVIFSMDTEVTVGPMS